MTDKDILEFIITNLECDGYGWWLPEWAVKDTTDCDADIWDSKPDLKEFRESLIHRMKNEAFVKSLQKAIE